MKVKVLILLIGSILLNSCRAYLDKETNNIDTDFMTFKYLKDHNEFDYFNRVNSSADTQIFYTTHFSINLPKGIIFWKQLGNQFYFEYSSKQIIYLYTAYKNQGNEFANWELKDVNNVNEFKTDLKDYWIGERDYSDNYFEVKQKGRINKWYTNGKYKIALYNIKDKNFIKFFESIKTFKVEE